MNAIAASRATRRSAGFTLVEMLTVIAVASILAAIAFPSFTWLAANTRVKSASSELYLAMIKARSEAVKRNASVTITHLGSTWADGWQVLDPNGNVLVQQDAFDGVKMPSTPATVTFSRSGRIQGATVKVEVEPSKSGVNVDRRCVSTEPSGRPYLKVLAEGDVC